MYPMLIKETRQQMATFTIKMNNILDKYKPEQDMNVKDLSDLERYSEILKNLSVYLDSFYGQW